MRIDDQNEKVMLEDEIADNINGPEKNSKPMYQPAEQEGAVGSSFVIELFFCSIILWCFLFLIASGNYEKIIFKVEDILSTRTSILFISNIEEALAAIIDQLL